MIFAKLHIITLFYYSVNFVIYYNSEIENVIVCEDILSDEVCATLRKAAEKLKVGAKIVDQFIREALKEGKIKAKEIIKYIEDKMAALSKVKCEDVLDEDVSYMHEYVQHYQH